MKSPIVRSTKDQINEFKDSIIWKDIKHELGVWKRLCTQEYGQVVGSNIGKSAEQSSSNVLLHIGDIHGRESAIDFLLTIPDVFLQILEDKENESECK